MALQHADGDRRRPPGAVEDRDDDLAVGPGVDGGERVVAPRRPLVDRELLGALALQDGAEGREGFRRQRLGAQGDHLDASAPGW